MTLDKYHCGPYTVTVWGGGIVVLLERGDLGLFFEGDEAAQIYDHYTEHGLTGLDTIWDEHQHLATTNGDIA